MSLQLSKTKPRQLQYAVGGLREDLKLIELDEHLLDAIKNDQVLIKGDKGDDAVLCTSNKTYALKLVETTNSLLLLPPQEELDEDFAAVPSLTPPDARDAARIPDVGLQTQLQKNAVAKDYPALTATATAKAHIELVEVAPRLDMLPQLLGRPYSLEDEEEPAAAAAAAGDDAAAGGVDGDDADMMDAEGPGAAETSSRCGCTTEQLLSRVQASRVELMAELGRLQALQMNGRWRLVEEAYLGALLEMLVMTALEKGWAMDAIPLREAVQALQPDGYIPAVMQHCLHVYGTPCPSQQQPNAPETEAAAPLAAPNSSSSSHYALDETRVCLHYARKLLQQQRVEPWRLQAFLAAWQEQVPGCWSPRQDMLAGEALIIAPDASEGVAEPRVRHFPARLLPSAPAARFAALFAAQPRWTREQLDPYLEGFKVPGQTVETLLLAHARASQRSPSDPTVVFVAR
ncbi:hypothetical protein OEZ86_001054 [Tetradesmus obliquus]|nr:hypothetical protein OEZ86_001054 [Tetradesmus obliquus]